MDRAHERIRTSPRGSRGSPTDDAWRRWRRRGVAAWAHTGKIEEHSSLDELIYIDFDQSLTAQNSKFHMGT